MFYFSDNFKMWGGLFYVGFFPAITKAAVSVPVAVACAATLSSSRGATTVRPSAHPFQTGHIISNGRLVK